MTEKHQRQLANLIARGLREAAPRVSQVDAIKYFVENHVLPGVGLLTLSDAKSYILGYLQRNDHLKELNARKKS